MEHLECLGNRVMQEDIEEIVAGGLSIDQLKGKTVLITGATGLIGSQLVYLLACYNRKSEADIRILAFVRNREKGERLFGHLQARQGVSICVGDINVKLTLQEPIDYIVHAASATSSRYFVSHPVETIQTALNGTRNVLELAKENHVEGMVYLSSLEVYGVPEKENDLITENDYGFIDPLSVRSSYSESKRMAECLCVSYAQEYGVPVKIARLSQTFGAGVEYEDGRVFAEFARCALEKRDIVLHTKGNTVRSYCYTKDAISAILHILLYGASAQAYNVTNMDTAVSIKEMAELVGKTIGESKIKVVIDIPEDVDSFGYNPEMVIRLDSSKLKALGWNATVGLAEMYQRMCGGFAR